MSKPNNDGNQSDRGAGGKFVKGNKASPGRTPGRSQVAELREKLAQDVDAVIRIVREQALAGDPQAIRILLDRVLPSLRPVELPTPLDMPTFGTLAEKAHAVIQATASGDITSGQAAQLISALVGVGKVTEQTELLSRVEALEKQHAKNP